MTRHARISIALLLFMTVAFGGCSEPARYVVTGVVNMDGAPAPFVVVKFFPIDPSYVGGGTGTTDASGKFSLGEDGKNTGLPRGEYKVTFSQTLVNEKPTLAGSGGKAAEKTPTEREAVAEEFRDREKTPVTATLGGGTNNFTFDIKASKN